MEDEDERQRKLKAAKDKLAAFQRNRKTPERPQQKKKQKKKDLNSPSIVGQNGLNEETACPLIESSPSDNSDAREFSVSMASNPEESDLTASISEDISIEENLVSSDSLEGAGFKIKKLDLNSSTKEENKKNEQDTKQESLSQLLEGTSEGNNDSDFVLSHEEEEEALPPDSLEQERDEPSRIVSSSHPLELSGKEFTTVEETSDVDIELDSLQRHLASESDFSLQSFASRDRSTRATLDEYRNKIQEYQSALSQRDAIIEQLTTRLNETLQNRDAIQAESAAQAEMLESEISALKIQLQEAVERIGKQKAKNGASSQELVGLQNQLTQLQRDYSDKDLTISDLQRQLKETSDEVVQLHNALKASEKKFTEVGVQAYESGDSEGSKVSREISLSGDLQEERQNTLKEVEAAVSELIQSHWAFLGECSKMVDSECYEKSEALLKWRQLESQQLEEQIHSQEVITSKYNFETEWNKQLAKARTWFSCLVEYIRYLESTHKEHDLLLAEKDSLAQKMEEAQQQLHEVGDVKEKMTAVTREKEEVQTELDRVKNELEMQLSKISSLQEELEKLQEENRQLSTDSFNSVEHLRLELSSAMIKNTDLEQELEKLRLELTEALDKYKKVCKDLDQANEEKLDRETGFKSVLEQKSVLEVKVQEVSEKNETLLKNAEYFEKQKALLEQELQNEIASRKGIENKVEELLQNSILSDEIKEKLEKSLAENLSLEQRLSESNGKLGEIEQKLKESISEKLSLEEKLSVNKTTLRDLQEQLKATVTAKLSLEQEMQEVIVSVKILENQINECKKELKDSQNEVDDLKAEKASIEEKLQMEVSLRKELENKIEELSKSKSVLSNIQMKLEESQKEKLALEERLQSEISLRNQLENRVCELSESNVVLEHTQTKLKENDAAKLSLEDELQRERSLRKYLENQVQQLKENISDFELKLVSANQSISNLQESLTKHKADSLLYQSECDVKAKKLQQLQEDLKKLQVKYKALQEEYNFAQHELDRHRANADRHFADKAEQTQVSMIDVSLSANQFAEGSHSRQSSASLSITHETLTDSEHFKSDIMKSFYDEDMTEDHVIGSYTATEIPEENTSMRTHSGESLPSGSYSIGIHHIAIQTDQVPIVPGDIFPFTELIAEKKDVRDVKGKSPEIEDVRVEQLMSENTLLKNKIFELEKDSEVLLELQLMINLLKEENLSLRNSVQSEKERLISDKIDTDAKLAEISYQLETAITSKNELELQIVELQAKLVKSSEELEQSIESVKSTSNESAGVASHMMNIDAAVATLQQQLHLEQDLKNNLNARLVYMTRKCEMYEKAHKELVNEANSLREQLQQAFSEHREALKNMAEFPTLKKKYETDLANLKKWVKEQASPSGSLQSSIKKPENIALFCSDFESSKAMLRQENEKLREALQAERAASEELRSKLFGDEGIIHWQDDEKIEVALKMELLLKSNRELLEEKELLSNHIKQQERLLEELKVELQQKPFKIQDDPIIKSKFDDLQTQREGLFSEMQSQKTHAGISDTFSSSSLITEVLRQEKEAILRKIEDKNVLEAEINRLKSELHCQQQEMTRLEEKLSHHIELEQNLERQNRVLEEDLREIEQKVREQYEELTAQRLDLEAELCCKDLMLRKCDLELREKQLEHKTQAMTMKLEHEESVGSLRRVLITENLETISKLRAAMDRHHETAVSRLRNNLEKKYALQEKKLSTEHTTESARMIARHQKQIEELQKEFELYREKIEVIKPDDEDEFLIGTEIAKLESKCEEELNTLKTALDTNLADHLNRFIDMVRNLYKMKMEAAEQQTMNTWKMSMEMQEKLTSAAHVAALEMIKTELEQERLCSLKNLYDKLDKKHKDEINLLGKALSDGMHTLGTQKLEDGKQTLEDLVALFKTCLQDQLRQHLQVLMTKWNDHYSNLFEDVKKKLEHGIFSEIRGSGGSEDKNMKQGTEEPVLFCHLKKQMSFPGFSTGDVEKILEMEQLLISEAEGLWHYLFDIHVQQLGKLTDAIHQDCKAALDVEKELQLVASTLEENDVLNKKIQEVVEEKSRLQKLLVIHNIYEREDNTISSNKGDDYASDKDLSTVSKETSDIVSGISGFEDESRRDTLADIEVYEGVENDFSQGHSYEESHKSIFEIEELYRKQYEERIEQYTNQLNDIKKKLESDYKEKTERMEKSYKEKSELLDSLFKKQLEKSLAKMNSDLEEMQKSEIEEIVKKHNAELNKLKQKYSEDLASQISAARLECIAEAAKQMESEVLALQNNHAEELQNVTKNLEERLLSEKTQLQLEREEEINRIKTKYELELQIRKDDILKEVQNEINSLQEQCKDLEFKTDMLMMENSRLQDEKNKSECRLKMELSDLVQEEKEERDALQQKLTKQHAKEIEKLKESHSQALLELIKKKDEELENLKRTVEKLFEEQKRQILLEHKETMTDETESVRVEEKVLVKKQIDALETEHASLQAKAIHSSNIEEEKIPVHEKEMESEMSIEDSLVTEIDSSTDDRDSEEITKWFDQDLASLVSENFQKSLGPSGEYPYPAIDKIVDFLHHQPSLIQELKSALDVFKESESYEDVAKVVKNLMEQYFRLHFATQQKADMLKKENLPHHSESNEKSQKSVDADKETKNEDSNEDEFPKEVPESLTKPKPRDWIEGTSCYTPADIQTWQVQAAQTNSRLLHVLSDLVKTFVDTEQDIQNHLSTLGLEKEVISESSSHLEDDQGIPIGSKEDYGNVSQTDVPSLELCEDGLDLTPRAWDLFVSAVNSLDTDPEGEDVVLGASRRLRSAVERVLHLLSGALENQNSQDFNVMLKKNEDLEQDLKDEIQEKEFYRMEFVKAQGTVKSLELEKQKLEDTILNLQELKFSLESELRKLKSLLGNLQEAQELIHDERQELEEQRQLLAEGLGEAEQRNPSREKNLSCIEENLTSESEELLIENNRLSTEKRKVQQNHDRERQRLLTRLHQLEVALEEAANQKEEALEQKRHEIEDLKSQMEAMEKQLQSNRRFIEEQTQEREQEREEYHKEVTKLREIIKEKERIQNSEERLNKEIEALEQQLKVKAEDYRDETLRREQIEKELRQNIDKIHDLKEIIRELESELDVKTRTEQDLSMQLLSLKEALSLHEKDTADLSREMEKLRSSMPSSDWNEYVSHLEGQIESQNQELEKARFCQSLLIEFRGQVHCLEEKVESKTRLLEASILPSPSSSPCHSESASISDHHEAHFLRISTEDIRTPSPASMQWEELRRLEEKIERLTLVEEDVINRNKEWESQLRSLKKENEILQNENTVLQERIQEHMSQIMLLKSRLEETRYAEARPKTDFKTLDRIADLHDDLLREKEKNSHLDKKLKESERMMHDIKVEVDDKDRKISQLIEETRNAKKIAEECFRERISFLEKENSKLKVEIKDLESSVENAPLPRYAQMLIEDKSEEIDMLNEQIRKMEDLLERIKKCVTEDEANDELSSTFFSQDIPTTLPFYEVDTLERVRNMLKRKNEVIRNLKQTAELRDVNLRIAQKEVEEKDAQLLTLRKQLEKSEQDIQSLSKGLTESDKDEGPSLSNAFDSGSNKGQSERMITEHIEYFREKMKQEEERILKSEASLPEPDASATYQATIKKLEFELSQERNKVTSLQQRVHSMTTEMEGIRSKLLAVEKKFTAVQTSSQKEKAALQAQVDTLLLEVERLNTYQDIDSSRKPQKVIHQREHLQKDFDEVQKMLEEKEEEITTIQQETEHVLELESQVESLKQLLLVQKHETQEQEAKFNALEEKYRKLLEEKKTLSHVQEEGDASDISQLELLRRETSRIQEQSKTQIQKLQDDLSKCKEKLDVMENEKNALEEKINTLQQEAHMKLIEMQNELEEKFLQEKLQLETRHSEELQQLQEKHEAELRVLKEEHKAEKIDALENFKRKAEEEKLLMYSNFQQELLTTKQTLEEKHQEGIQKLQEAQEVAMDHLKEHLFNKGSGLNIQKSQDQLDQEWQQLLKEVRKAAELERQQLIQRHQLELAELESNLRKRWNEEKVGMLLVQEEKLRTFEEESWRRIEELKNSFLDMVAEQLRSTSNPQHDYLARQYQESLSKFQEQFQSFISMQESKVKHIHEDDVRRVREDMEKRISEEKQLSRMMYTAEMNQIRSKYEEQLEAERVAMTRNWQEEIIKVKEELQSHWEVEKLSMERLHQQEMMDKEDELHRVFEIEQKNLIDMHRRELETLNNIYQAELDKLRLLLKGSSLEDTFSAGEESCDVTLPSTIQAKLKKVQQEGMHVLTLTEQHRRKHRSPERDLEVEELATNKDILHLLNEKIKLLLTALKENQSNKQRDEVVDDVLLLLQSEWKLLLNHFVEFIQECEDIAHVDLEHFSERITRMKSGIIEVWKYFLVGFLDELSNDFAMFMEDCEKYRSQAKRLEENLRSQEEQNSRKDWQSKVQREQFEFEVKQAKAVADTLKVTVNSERARNLEILAHVNEQREQCRELESSLSESRAECIRFRQMYEHKRQQAQSYMESYEAEKAHNQSLLQSLEVEHANFSQLQITLESERRRSKALHEHNQNIIKDLRAALQRGDSFRIPSSSFISQPTTSDRYLFSKSPGLESSHSQENGFGISSRQSLQICPRCERIVSRERAQWQYDKMELHQSLHAAENEILRLRKLVQMEVPEKPQNLEIDVEAKIHHLTWKVRRSESYRRALVYQKNYLMLVIGGFHSTEKATLALLAHMGAYDVNEVEEGPRATSHSQSLPQCVHLKGRFHFRAAAFAIIAVQRMKYTVHLWRRSRRMPSRDPAAAAAAAHLPHHRFTERKISISSQGTPHLTPPGSAGWSPVDVASFTRRQQTRSDHSRDGYGQRSPSKSSSPLPFYYSSRKSSSKSSVHSESTSGHAKDNSRLEKYVARLDHLQRTLGLDSEDQS